MIAMSFGVVSFRGTSGCVSRGLSDGRDRARLGVLRVEGRDVPIPRDGAEAHRADRHRWTARRGGVEARCARGPFQRYDGVGNGRYKTYARMLWDDHALYLAFEAPDRDVHTPYTQRDEPIYESEAVEIFIGADGMRMSTSSFRSLRTGCSSTLDSRAVRAVSWTRHGTMFTRRRPASTGP